MHCKPFAAALLAASMAIASNAVLAHGASEPDADPLLITSGDPQDPLFANAGSNLKNGVGSIFIEFRGITEGGFICTATAIGDYHVVTAAHCVRNADDTVRRIRFILSAGLSSPVLIDAAGFAVQPLYDITSPILGAFAHGDIAVIELAQPIPPGIETYPLYTGTDEFGKDARHYGHGRSGKGNKGATGDADFFFGRTGLNRYEQFLEPLVGTGIEDQLLSDFDSGGRKHNAMEWWFTSSFACHPDNPDNRDHAQDGQCTTFKDGSFPDFEGFGTLEIGIAPGDSGGPAFIDGKIAGVHSFGFTHFCEGVTNGTDFTCGLDSSYGEVSGDTRVSTYAAWVNDVVGGTEPVTPVPEPLPAAARATASANVTTADTRAGAFLQNVHARTMRLQVEAR